MINRKIPSILYLITQGEYGGAQHYIMDLAKAFSHDYDVCVAFGEVDKSRKFIDLLERHKIRYHIINELRRELSWSDDYQALKAIRTLIKQEEPDLIHLNSSKISILGTLANLGLKSRLVYTAHGWVFNEVLPEKIKRAYVWAERLSAYKKERIICVSDFDRQSAINHRIAPANKLSVIHNGIPDFDLLEREAARQVIERELDETNLFLSKEFTIGSIGYLYKNKGFDYLINACRILVKAGHNPLLLIVGGGPEKKELENWINQLGLEDNVRILGETENASRLLRAFDIYVCSSLKEGLSYTVIEAMTAGLPIVATDVGGNAELIDDFKEGLICRPGDAEELAKDILVLHDDPQRAGNLARAAHEKAIRNFEIEQMIQKTAYVYQSLLDN